MRRERNVLQQRSLQVVVCTVAVSVSAAVPVFVRADTPNPPQSVTTPESAARTILPNAVPAPADNSRRDAASRTQVAAQKPEAASQDTRSRAFDRNAVLDRTLSRGKYLVRTALSYRGLPYRWGGTSPRSGFDCSGLVQTVYAKWGIYLPRCASEQVAKGTPVPKDKLLAGDLVFFKNTYKRGLSHVGIYVGEGWFIHAASARYGVILSRLDADYNRNHWYGARRLNLSKLPPEPNEKQPETPKIILDENGTADTDAWTQQAEQMKPGAAR